MAQYSILLPRRRLPSTMRFYTRNLREYHLPQTLTNPLVSRPLPSALARQHFHIIGYKRKLCLRNRRNFHLTVAKNVRLVFNYLECHNFVLMACLVNLCALRRRNVSISFAMRCVADDCRELPKTRNGPTANIAMPTRREREKKNLGPSK